MKQVIVLMLLVAMSFCGFAQDNHPVSWNFSTEQTGPLTYKVKFVATVKEPYHIYPQQSFDAGFGIPTEFLFAENPDVELIGEMEEKGAEQKGPKRLPYYSKGVTFTQTLKLKSGKKTTLAFTIKYMACTNQMCLPPSKKSFTLILNDQEENAVTKTGNPPDTTHIPEVTFKYENFSMPDTAGKVIASKDITFNAKYTLVDFWASWCIPCRALGRELIPIFNKYNRKGFSVIGVSLDTDAKAWKKAIRADGYVWTNLSDLEGFESPISKTYNITAIPRNFLVDHSGIIIAKDLHAKELEDKLYELLK